MSHGPTKAELQRSLDAFQSDYQRLLEELKKANRECTEADKIKAEYWSLKNECDEAHRCLDMIPGAPLGDRGDTSIFPGAICYKRTPLTLSQRIVGLVVHMMTPKPSESICVDPTEFE